MIGKKSYSKVEWIYEHDPALNKKNKAFSYEKFEDDADLKHLPIRKGCEPTVFTVRQLTRRQFISATSQSDLNTAMDEAIRYGLVAVKNFKLDGKPVIIVREKTDLGEAVTEKSFDDLFTQNVFGALGTFILKLSRLDPLS